MMMTMSIGVRIACPVMRSPREKEHLDDLLRHRVDRVGQDALEGDPPFLDGGHDAFEPGFGQHDPAADLATSVAVDTAIPICACLSAGASLAPSPHMPTVWPLFWNA